VTQTLTYPRGTDLTTGGPVRNDVSLTPRAGTAEETAVWFVNAYLTVPEPVAAGLLPFAAAAMLLRRRRAA